MSSGFKKTAAAIAMSAMVIAPIATAGLVLTTEAAFAKSEKDAEKSAGKNDRGKNARVLKNLNAANSWKQGQGYMNANPDSNIGIIKTYYDVRVLQTPFEMDLAAFLAFHNLDATAAVDDYVVACDNDQVCIDAEAEYDGLFALVATAMGDSTMAFDLIKPDGWDDPEGKAIAYFDAALGF